MSLKAPSARKKSKEEPEETQERNRLALGLVFAAGGGFLTAMYLGAFSGSEMKNVPPWLSAVTSVFAMLISALAVYLVAKTLQATRETLDATREMANDQKRVGEAQIRPYLLIESKKIHLIENGIEVEIKLTNYGNTPAVNAVVNVTPWGHMYEVHDENEGPVHMVSHPFNIRSKFEAAVPQGSKLTLQSWFPKKVLEDPDFQKFSFIVDWEYYSHDRKEKYTDDYEESVYH